MKKLIAELFLLPLLAKAQDCKLKKGKDDMTSQTILSTGFIPFESDFNLSMDANSKEIDFFFVVKVGSRCFDETTIMTVVFEGKNQKQEYKNTGGTNCEGTLHVIFRNSAYTAGALTKLMTKKAVSIAFTDANGKVNTVTLNPQEQQALMENATCIANQGKTLIGQ